MTDDNQDSGGVGGSASTGKIAVLAMIGAAVLAASFAWWWNYNRGRRSLEFYGAEAATLIRTAPKVEILRPEPEGNIDISTAPGLINARASLLSDASYDWSAPESRQESPLFSVRFSRGGKSVVITFDFENRTISNTATQRAITLNPKTADGWKQYLARHSKEQHDEHGRTSPRSGAARSALNRQ
jgi:hypothetical protein